ncbi:hypothetical protein OH76DRAFT_1484494 [Lentinus brumalis]|uniref:Uncharacterized protein n=1 Tax=Lentinus brumalis TaxID=2498619 RepID=A0A371D5J9_9APHY|nr:hypothetical protein OH76DRAFT_1484494 [Polyporus brumalis]
MEQDTLRLHNKIGGFLYYHQPPHAPPLAGELRFRITTAQAPATFLGGSDLMTKCGVPWCIPLPVIAGNETYAPIRRLLVAVDRTVPLEVMNVARQHSRVVPAVIVAGTRCVHAFGQPFDLSFLRHNTAVAFVGKNRIEHTRLHKMTYFQTGSSGPRSQLHFPFSGTVMCCFEPSPLPEHSGKRVAVVRVLRSLEWDSVRRNPSYDGPQVPPELYPREGQLLMTMQYRRPRPWSFDVDKHSSKRGNAAAPLGVLFENATEYGSAYFQ